MRIAAAGAARGASDILPAVLAHHIGQGITDFYLVLHNEDRSVSENVVAAFGTRANFTIIHHEHPDFDHGAISNMLLAQARRDGFDVYLPFDSDEFYVSTDSRFSLAEVIERWFVGETTEQIHVPNKNFIGPQSLDQFTTRSLSRMTHRFEYKHGVRNVDMRRRLEAMCKSISRLSGIPDADFTFVQAGNHSTYRGRQRLSLRAPEVPFNFGIEILHVPFRSRFTTEEPQHLKRAMEAADLQPDELTQVEMKERFLQTWNEVSLSAAEQAAALTDRGNSLLYADDALNRILAGIASAGFDIDDPWCSSRNLPGPDSATYSSQVFANEPFFELAITALAAQSRRMDEQSSDYSRLRHETRATVTRLRERLAKLREANAQLRERSSQPEKEELSHEGHSGPVTTYKSSLERIRAWGRALRTALAEWQRDRRRRHRNDSNEH